MIIFFFFWPQVCQKLGTIESDYFGLQFTRKNGGDPMWLNLRNPINSQVTGPSPLRLQLRVKFHVQPHLVLQEVTRWEYVQINLRGTRERLAFIWGSFLTLGVILEALLCKERKKSQRQSLNQSFLDNICFHTYCVCYRHGEFIRSTVTMIKTW